MNKLTPLQLAIEQRKEIIKRIQAGDLNLAFHYAAERHRQKGGRKFK